MHMINSLDHEIDILYTRLLHLNEHRELFHKAEIEYEMITAEMKNIGEEINALAREWAQRSSNAETN